MQLSAMHSQWDRVAGMMALTTIFNTLDTLGTEINRLGSDVSDIRARGYRFGRDWDERFTNIQTRWPNQHNQAMQMVEIQQRQLQNTTHDIEMLVRQASANHNMIGSAQTRISSLENSVRAAETSIQGVYSGLRNEVNDLQHQVRQAKDLLDALDSASFPLLPDEHGIAYCKAQWVSDQQQPEGRLFLTDRRLVFEQYEERATKKVLFITTAKELIQKMLWESPVGAVDEMTTADEKKFMGRKEMLTLHFNERTRELPSDAVLELKGGADNDTWRALIRRVKSGQIDGDRFGAPPPQERLAAEVSAEATAAEAGKELPTKCPSCNAPLPPIFKGMRQVSCDYCGAVINI